VIDEPDPSLFQSEIKGNKTRMQADDVCEY